MYSGSLVDGYHWKIFMRNCPCGSYSPIECKMIIHNIVRNVSTFLKIKKERTTLENVD